MCAPTCPEFPRTQRRTTCQGVEAVASTVNFKIRLLKSNHKLGVPRGVQDCWTTSTPEYVTLGKAVNKSRDAACRQRMTLQPCHPSKVQEKPEERATPVAINSGPETCEFVVGCGRHENTTANNGQASDARTIGGMDVCVLDDNYDERHDEPGQKLEYQEDSEEGDVDCRGVPQHIHRMLFFLSTSGGRTHLRRTSSRHAIWITDVSRCCEKRTRQGLVHMQGHSVFEFVWQSEVGSLTQVCSKWLQDMHSDDVKAKFVAPQVVCGERDDVFAGTPPLAVARTWLAMAASRNLKETRYIGVFDIRHRHVQRRMRRWQPDGNHRDVVY